MKRAKLPSLAMCLAAAIFGALLIGALQYVLWPWLGGFLAVRAMVVTLTLAYVGFLLAAADRRPGRLVIGALATVLSAATFFGPFGLASVLAVHGGLVWIVRVVCYRKSLLGSLLDGALVLFGLAAAAAAFHATSSFAWAAWAGLLTQCLFAYVPDQWSERPQSSGPGEQDRFNRAFSAADSALRALASK